MNRPTEIGHRKSQRLQPLPPSILHTCIILGLVVFAAMLTRTAAAQLTGEFDRQTRHQTYRLTVSPAAAPEPRLRHRLMLRELELQPGNAASYYYRSLLDLSRITAHIDNTLGEEYDRWRDANDTPLGELPRDRVRTALRAFEGAPLQSLRDATSRADCNWEWGFEDLRGPEVIAFLLPEVQHSRDLMRMLSLRARLALAEGRFEDALDSMRMNYRLSRDVGETPFLVAGLVGIAGAGIADVNALELIATPGSPNLYWSMSELPRPLIDLRRAVRFEMSIGPRVFPILENAEQADRAPEEWNRMLAETVADIPRIDTGRMLDLPQALQQAEGGLRATAFAMLGYSHAKEQLIAQGMDRSQVEAMAVGQVIAVYSSRVYQHFADELESLWYMPYAEAQVRSREIFEELRAVGPAANHPRREVIPVASILLPAVQASQVAQMRMELRLDAIRVIEALRMHAAEHGRLPRTLAEVTVVPIPKNPATGDDWVYHLEDGSAVLEQPASDGLNFSSTYEITLRN